MKEALSEPGNSDSVSERLALWGRYRFRMVTDAIYCSARIIYMTEITLDLQNLSLYIVYNNHCETLNIATMFTLMFITLNHAEQIKSQWELSKSDIYVIIYFVDFFGA